MGLGAAARTLHRRALDPREHGPLLACTRAALGAASVPYALAVAARNRVYDAGRKAIHRAPVPVISIGNITAGGTGKTPMAAALARLLVERGRRPAILSRGYGHDPQSGMDDENRMLARLAPGAAVIVNPDRAAGAARAVAAAGADVLILDDGFQHRRLARDLDLVLIDALDPFGGGHLLPRGLLREPLKGLARADLTVITRSDLVPAERIEEIRARLAQHSNAPVALAEHRPAALLRVCGAGREESMPLSALSEGRWGAVCGIGNPEGFKGTLERLGARVDLVRAYPDHHRYREGEMASLLAEAAARGLQGVLTTEKDADKIAAALPPHGPQTPVLALSVRIEITEGLDALERLLGERLG